MVAFGIFVSWHTRSNWVLLIAFQQFQQSFVSYFHGAESGRSCRFLWEKIHPFEDGLKLTFLKFNSELSPKEKKQMPRKRITVIELSLSCIKFQGVSRCSEKTCHKKNLGPNLLHQFFHISDGILQRVGQLFKFHWMNLDAKNCMRFVTQISWKNMELLFLKWYLVELFSNLSKGLSWILEPSLPSNYYRTVARAARACHLLLHCRVPCEVGEMVTAGATCSTVSPAARIHYSGPHTTWAPKKVAKEGESSYCISGKYSLVKYYNLAR